MCPFPSYFYSFSPCIFQLLMINDNDGGLQQLFQKSCSFFVHRYVVMVHINLRTHTHKKATCSCSSVGLVGWEWWWVNVLVGMFLHWKKETWWNDDTSTVIICLPSSWTNLVGLRLKELGWFFGKLHTRKIMREDLKRICKIFQVFISWRSTTCCTCFHI